MLVSHKYKFLSIGIPKTGTKSLRAFFCTSSQHRDGRRNEHMVDIIGFDKDNKFPQHASYIKCKQDMDSLDIDIKDYFVFSFVRNPWARLVSHMLWSNETFNENRDLKFFIEMNAPQYAYICNESEDLAVNYLARFENYEQEIKSFCNKFKIHHMPIPHLQKTKKYNYKDFYTKELIDKVYEKEHKIIDLMSYTYD
jgi:hypothetical protein